MKKQTVQLLQRLLLVALFVLLLKIIIDSLGSTNQNTQTLHKKLNNINSRIQKLKNDRLLPTTTYSSVKKKDIENKLRQAQYEKNHYLSILRNQKKDYSNHDYNSLENRLKARIENNRIKKMDNMAKKLNELHAASKKTRPPARPPALPPARPPALPPARPPALPPTRPPALPSIPKVNLPSIPIPKLNPPSIPKLNAEW